MLPLTGSKFLGKFMAALAFKSTRPRPQGQEVRGSALHPAGPRGPESRLRLSQVSETMPAEQVQTLLLPLASRWEVSWS